MQPTTAGKEGDDSLGGREGEKGGGLLLNYSISGDHPGLILYRDDEDVKLSKDLLDGIPSCAMCRFGSSAGHSLKCLI